MGGCSLLTGHAFCVLPGTGIRFISFPEPLISFATVILPFPSLRKSLPAQHSVSKTMVVSSAILSRKAALPNQ